jgi:hypothetical protein
MKKEMKATKAIIQCRLSYANIWEPKEDDNGNKKYSASLIIPKSDKKTIAAIKKAIEAAKAEGKSKLANSKGKIPANIKLPLRDADEEDRDDAAYAGCVFMNASSKRKPQIVSRSLEVITDEDAVYSGCYANVSVNFYAFSKDGNKGIAAGLGNIQKLKDGERLSGGSTAEEDFDELEEDEEEEEDIF